MFFSGKSVETPVRENFGPRKIDKVSVFHSVSSSIVSMTKTFLSKRVQVEGD